MRQSLHGLALLLACFSILTMSSIGPFNNERFNHLLLNFVMHNNSSVPTLPPFPTSSSTYGCSCPMQIWASNINCSGSAAGTFEIPIPFGQCNTIKNSTGTFASMLTTDCLTVATWSGSKCAGKPVEIHNLTGSDDCMTHFPGEWGGVTGVAYGSVAPKCHKQPRSTPVQKDKTCHCVAKMYNDSYCTSTELLRTTHSFMVAGSCLNMHVGTATAGIAISSDCAQLEFHFGPCSGNPVTTQPLNGACFESAETPSSEVHCTRV
eukprot:TRINITY_DN68431_c0_g1_i1.p1 TRINITY_DN68431_c0_g1~~TRINITY_DN68431_c0_g1_i1.p1  ORF type:complete len:263 (+),score=15.17 TRINITY_DN68431_c0_g1_i1:12-800(+)